MQLAKTIRRCRSKANLSQMALAEKLGISPNYLSNIERCKAWVTPKTLASLTNVFNIEI
jgi:transcriptional regulator with XRE-family HTH domain